ncbi:MAG TPA: TonB-dependent receptor [Polyangiales bacterium]|nr:TonB-dependent receptor [Polyangiales bacterium]
MLRLALAFVFVGLATSRVAAQSGAAGSGVAADGVAENASPNEFEARATAPGERLVATHGEDPTAAGTTLDVQNRVAVPQSLGDIVREAPGARIQNTGGLGAFSSVSLRGADGSEALVLLDEIPLVTPDGGAFDLSTFPAELFERVDVFRGGAPVWLGSGAVGGVLRLVPRRAELSRYDLAASAGSFGSWQLQLGFAVGRPDRLTLRARAVVRTADNDYPYLDDNGTRFEPDDDATRRRRNAQLTDASGFVDLGAPLLGGRIHTILVANGRTGGEPGPGSQPTPDIHRSRQRVLAGVAFDRSWGNAESPASRLQLVAASSYLHDRYTDLYGELGTSRRWNTDDDAYRGFIRAAGTLRLARWLEATAVGSYALDEYDPSDQFTFPAPAPSNRHDVAAALELAARGALGPVVFELRPSARVEWSRTELHADRGATGPFDSTRALTKPTGRIAAGLAPFPALAVTASIATGVRLPTMFELFGDRGLVLPAPNLQPATSTTYDAGVTLKHETAAIRGALELHGFLQQRRDEIGTFRTAQFQVAHFNSSDVEQRGFELGVQAVLFELFAIHGAATYLRTEDALGKRLPMRPVWNVFVRPELRKRFAALAMSAGVAAEINYRSFAFADRANLAVISECSTAALSASIGFLRDRLRLSGRLEDLTNARCTDLVGYPLPGRSLLFTLTWKESEHEKV